ncbi:MAG: acyl-CoA dehydrogenase family protein [Acidimicrobiales bacterium]
MSAETRTARKIGTGELAGLGEVLGQWEVVIGRMTSRLAETGGPDGNQVLGYDLAHAAAAIAIARSSIEHATGSDAGAPLAAAFAGHALAGIASSVFGREDAWAAGDLLSATSRAIRPFRDPAFLAELATATGSPLLSEDFELARDTFRRFAEERVRPFAEEVHRQNGDVPEAVISGLAELGGFGLSVPEAYGGMAAGSADDYLAMVIATEELSRASLGIGGSLITRPEIITRALLAGGTEEQKRAWLPRLATGEIMGAVAVTEPDFGSDVAGITTTATRTADGWSISGVKTWCTFAARAEVLLLLARTGLDRSAGHKGLSLFLVEKPRTGSEGFKLTQDAGGGTLEGRPIPTIGYRGMHSYELAFGSWTVPEQSLVGGAGGVGRGFYLQMEGFAAGRLQTAARAIGVMQAAYEAALSYSCERRVFGSPIIDYQLSAAKLATMAASISACRQFTYRSAREMGHGRTGPDGAGRPGALAAAMAKAYSCKAAEWVTREAMQLHGGMGYAEEFPVSRYFVDARVLSIFEGADEVLSLKVIARSLAAAGR